MTAPCFQQIGAAAIPVRKRPGRPVPMNARGQAVAFTLLEVILAISIAVGILAVVLFFYQQATVLRGHALQETERIAAARLLMERITAELRTAHWEGSFGKGFAGSSNSIQFIKADVPSFSSWMGGALGRSAFPVTDLRVIQYRLESADGTNVAGLLRLEEPLVPASPMAGSENLVETDPVLSEFLLPPLVEEIRYLRFRYWSGTNWVDSWNLPGSPQGVEVSLGAEPLLEDSDPSEPNPDLFRRVIYLAARDLSPGVSVDGRADAGGRSASGEEWR